MREFTALAVPPRHFARRIGHYLSPGLFTRGRDAGTFTAVPVLLGHERRAVIGELRSWAVTPRGLEVSGIARWVAPDVPVSVGIDFVRHDGELRSASIVELSILLEGQRAGLPGARVLVAGVDAPGPHRSGPGLRPAAIGDGASLDDEIEHALALVRCH